MFIETNYFRYHSADVNSRHSIGFFSTKNHLSIDDNIVDRFGEYFRKFSIQFLSDSNFIEVSFVFLVKNKTTLDHDLWVDFIASEFE